MLLELFPFVILNNGFCICIFFFSDFLCFDMSILLLTVTLRGYLISIAYCLFSILFCYERTFEVSLSNYNKPISLKH